MRSYSAQRQLDLHRAARADPQVRMFDDIVPQANERSIYLSTTFSESRCHHNHFWHLACREMLRKLCYLGLILIPESRLPYGGNHNIQHMRWCSDALAQASHLIFVIEKNQNEQEVRQIIHQLGIVLGHKSVTSSQTILVSAPNRRIPCPLTKYNLSVAGIPVFSNLHELLHHMTDI